MKCICHTVFFVVFLILYRDTDWTMYVNLYCDVHIIYHAARVCYVCVFSPYDRQAWIGVFSRLNTHQHHIHLALADTRSCVMCTCFGFNVNNWWYVDNFLTNDHQHQTLRLMAENWKRPTNESRENDRRNSFFMLGVMWQFWLKFTMKWRSRCIINDVSDEYQFLCI